MVKAELKQARLKRGTIKGALTRAHAFLDFDDANTASSSQIRQHKGKIEATWDEFDKIQTIIDLTAEGEVMDETRKYFDISRFDELMVMVYHARVEGLAPIREEEQEYRHERDANHTNRDRKSVV